MSTRKSTYVSKAQLGDQWVMASEAAGVLESLGEDAFPEFRQGGSKWFRDATYLLIWATDGSGVFHAASPSLEGRSILELEDVSGKTPATAYVAIAVDPGSGWVDYQWYRHGSNTPARTETYMQKVRHGDDVFVVGSGLYVE